MIKHVKKIVSHPLISGSGIIFVGSFTVNVLNYLFNLGMGRLMSVSDYGLLVSLTALITLLTLFQASLTNLFAKFAASYSAKKDSNARSSLVWSGTKITFAIGLFFFVILLALLNPLLSFFHINSVLLMTLVFFSVLFAVLQSLPAGVMQGELKFIQISVVNVIGAVGKIALGVILVLMGLGVAGATIGVLFSFVLPYLLSYFYVLFTNGMSLRSSKKIEFFKSFKQVSGPFLLASIAITLIQGTDVIFARHFLSSMDAGLFAALTLMGKAIFYITSPIYFAFFPIIAQKKEKKEKTSGTLILASGILLVSSVVFTLIYFIFPGFIIHIFFPPLSYQVLTPYLGLYALYISIFSFAFLMNNYFLSTGRVEVYKINWIFALVYLLLILYFHSNIIEFIYVLCFSSFLLFIALLVYYLRNARD